MQIYDDYEVDSAHEAVQSIIYKSMICGSGGILEKKLVLPHHVEFCFKDKMGKMISLFH